MAKILITGGAGFIGAHVARALLARGDRVDAVFREDATREKPGRRLTPVPTPEWKRASLASVHALTKHVQERRQRCCVCDARRARAALALGEPLAWRERLARFAGRIAGGAAQPRLRAEV